MGYTTTFLGEFTITPALTEAQVSYLLKFSETRRMKRMAELARKLPDPCRTAVNLPIGRDGEYFVGWTRTESWGRDDSLLNYNLPPADQPGLWCHWVPTEEGTSLEWDGAEKFYDYVEWLEYLIKHFFTPWGRTLNGRVEWHGEEFEDIGIIRVKDNLVESKDAEIAKYLATILP